MKTNQWKLMCMAMIVAVTSNAQQLTNIESVEYDPVYQRWLVSNGSTVIEVDGTGSPVAYFGTDPAADYGMEVMGNVLYAVVIEGSANNYVKGYDLTSGLEVASILIDEAAFLNGMASDGDHRVWVTDFTNKDIYEIDFTDLGNPVYTLVVNNTVTTPNGICYDADNSRLVFANWGASAKIKEVSLPDYTVTTLVENAGVGSIDGIDIDGQGNFFICSWQPVKVKKYNNDFSVEEVITVPGLSQPADLCYSPETDTLAIPSAGNSTVKFVGFTKNSVEATEENPFALSCYPNPLCERSVLYFTLTEAGNTTIDIYNTQGQLVLNFWEENLPAANHKLVTGIPDIASGNYFWKIASGARVSMVPFVK
ncbi:MAG: SMP-30/gluconolactonase/LRE family protein [Flavobacteriales bacterium]